MISVLMMGQKNWIYNFVKEAYKRQTWQDFEIIEFDNTENKYSLGYCFNECLEKAKGEYVLITHMDCIPDSNLIRNYKIRAEKNVVLAGSSFDLNFKKFKRGMLFNKVFKNYYFDKLLEHSWLSSIILRFDNFLSYTPELQNSETPYYMLKGRNFLAPTWAVKQVGGWEDMEVGPAPIDWEMGVKLHGLGLKITSFPEAIIWHVHNDKKSFHSEKMKNIKSKNMNKFFEIEKRCQVKQENN